MSRVFGSTFLLTGKCTAGPFGIPAPTLDGLPRRRAWFCSETSDKMIGATMGCPCGGAVTASTAMMASVAEQVSRTGSALSGVLSGAWSRRFGPCQGHPNPHRQEFSFVGYLDHMALLSRQAALHGRWP
ncbi:hypothetical protein F4808DRAFT_128753 [Astrocystis sublimbata]|nr:hypothetical protein F4808DRAFT_128753 [Astrocystis sublimbata]